MTRTAVTPCKKCSGLKTKDQRPIEFPSDLGAVEVEESVVLVELGSLQVYLFSPAFPASS